MFVFLNILWLFRTSRYVLFWIYLWQLKEYHVGRFLDHFRTHKGKKILFNYLLIFKIILAALFLLLSSEIFYYLLAILFLLYLAEFIFFLKAIFTNTLKIPEATFKTLFLTAASFGVIILFLLFIVFRAADVPWKPVSLLVFDILTPIIISAVVLLVQPAFVLARNGILKKAERKISAQGGPASGGKNYKNFTTIAITGSYGKTSTKEFLKTILPQKFKVLATDKHQNAEIGIAKCILNNLKPEHEIFIAEVGAYNKGKVKEVCKILNPKIGIVTGVNEQHLSLFGSMENLLSAEGGGELAEILLENGLLIVNGENKYCLNLYKNFDPSASSGQDGEKRIYSIKNDKIDSDIWTEDIEVSENSISFLVLNKQREMAHFKVNVLGKQNVQNLLAAVLTAKELGMSLEEIANACQNIKQEQAGIVLKTGKYGIKIIDSSYSSNPDGVLADLDYLSVFTGKKIVVMPCLIELGEKSSQIHQKISKRIAEICDLAIITSKDKYEDLKAGFDSVIPAKAGIQNGGKIIFMENSQEIFSKITTFCSSGDAVLLEGRVPGKLIDLLAG